MRGDRCLRALVWSDALHLVDALELGEQRHIFERDVGVLQAVPARRVAGGAANEVLEDDGRALGAVHIGFGGKELAQHDELERTDGARLLVDRILVGLVGELAGCGEVGDYLAQIGVHTLIDLIAQEQVHAEDVVGAKGLNGIGERIGLVHGLDVDEPVSAGSLRVLVENRVDHVAIDVIGVAVLGEVDDVVAHQLVGLVIAQTIELRQVGAQRQQRCLATLDGGAVEPAHHDAHDQRCHQNGEIAAVEEFGE